jgi:hypothetical protein
VHRTVVLRAGRFRGTLNCCTEDRQVQGDFELSYLGGTGAEGPRTNMYVKP